MQSVSDANKNDLFGAPERVLGVEEEPQVRVGVERPAIPVLGKIFDDEDIPYIFGGVALGVVQPFVVGYAIDNDTTCRNVNIATGVIALAVGVASRAGYIDAVPKKANAAMIGYGVSILAMVALGELMKYWDSARESYDNKSSA